MMYVDDELKIKVVITYLFGPKNGFGINSTTHFKKLKTL